MRKNSFVKKLLKERRGLAIELTLIAMIVVFSLGALITTTAILQSAKKKAIREDFTLRIELEQIGEEFCAAYLGGGAATASFEQKIESGGIYEIEIDGSKLTVSRIGQDEILLSVTVTDGKITEWKRGGI